MSQFVHWMSVHCLLLSQLDNQLAGAVFSTVLAPVPPPKTVAAESGQCLLASSMFSYYCFALAVYC